MALLTYSDWRDILSTLGLLLVVIAFYLTLKKRWGFKYYEATTSDVTINLNGVLEEYEQESKGKILRKKKSTGEWQVLRQKWNNGWCSYKWVVLEREKVSNVETLILEGKPINLYFD